MSRIVFSAFAAVILFLCCFPVATNSFDNRIVDMNSTSHFIIHAFRQRQLSTLPQLNDEALHVQLVIEEQLLFPTSMVFIDNNTLLVTQKNDGNVICTINGTVMRASQQSPWRLTTKVSRVFLELQQWKTPHHPAIQNLSFCTLQNHSEGSRQETEYTDMNGIKKINY